VPPQQKLAAFFYFILSRKFIKMLWSQLNFHAGFSRLRLTSMIRSASVSKIHFKFSPNFSLVPFLLFPDSNSSMLSALGVDPFQIEIVVAFAPQLFHTSTKANPN